MATRPPTAVSISSSHHSLHYFVGAHFMDGDTRNFGSPCMPETTDHFAAEIEAVIRVLEVIIDSDSDCIIIQTSRRDVSTCLLVLLPLYHKYGWEELPLSLVPHEPRLRYLSALLDLTSAFVSFEEAPIRVVAAADTLAKSSYDKIPPLNRSWLQAECAARLVYLRALLQTPPDERTYIDEETKLAAKKLEDVHRRVQQVAAQQAITLERSTMLARAFNAQAHLSSISSEKNLSGYLAHVGGVPSQITDHSLNKTPTTIALPKTICSPPESMFSSGGKRVSASALQTTTAQAKTKAKEANPATSAEALRPISSKPKSVLPTHANPSPPLHKSKYVRSAVLSKASGLPFLRKRLQAARRCEEAYPNIVHSRASWPDMPIEFSNDVLDALCKITASSPPTADRYPGPRAEGKRSAQSESDGGRVAKRQKTGDGELPAGGFLIEKSHSYVVVGTDNVLDELIHFRRRGGWKTSPIIAVVWLSGLVLDPHKEVFSIIPHLVNGLDGVKLVVLPQTGTWRTLAPPQAIFDPFQGPVVALKASTKVDLTDMEELLARIAGQDNNTSRVTLPATKTRPTLRAGPPREKTVPLPVASSSRMGLSSTTPATSIPNTNVQALSFPPPPPTTTPPPLPQRPALSMTKYPALAASTATLPQRPPPTIFSNRQTR